MKKDNSICCTSINPVIADGILNGNSNGIGGLLPMLFIPISTKGICMYKIMFTNRVKIASLLFLLFTIPALAGTDNKPLASDQDPHLAPQATRPSRQAARDEDDFAGLTLTAEQKAKIDQIHKDMITRMDIVAKDPASSADQKEAMLVGYARMERNQIFQILTPEQKAEVHKKIIARRTARKMENRTPPLQPK
jgi:Spy/CpxP family protein refolding chaperone